MKTLKTGLSNEAQKQMAGSLECKVTDHSATSTLLASFFFSELLSCSFTAISRFRIETTISSSTITPSSSGLTSGSVIIAVCSSFCGSSSAEGYPLILHVGSSICSVTPQSAGESEHDNEPPPEGNELEISIQSEESNEMEEVEPTATELGIAKQSEENTEMEEDETEATEQKISVEGAKQDDEPPSEDNEIEISAEHARGV